jgi:DNA polymerase
MTVNSMTKQWVRTSTYGGKSCENICQGICRDIMADAMLRLEAAGYPVVLTVHDEIISEVPKDFGSVEEYEALVSTVPAWAKGFPLTAKGWRGERYKK